MADKIKKVVLGAGLVGASTCAAYSAVQLAKSIKTFNKTIKEVDYNDLRKEVRHFVEMIEMMRYGVKE